MFYRLFTTSLVACGMILALGGCGQGSNTTTPDTTPDIHSANQINQQMCWGMYDITINGDTGEIETVPLRTVDFNCNVVRFLQPPIAPIELITLELNPYESIIMEGLIELDITLRHPFPGKTMFRGFDVHGIIMSDGSNTGVHDPTLIFRGPDEMDMINADGYTRWWNQVEFTTYGTILGYCEGHYAKPGYTSTSTLNPYKLHTPELEPEQPAYQIDPATRATFPAVDGAVRRTYRLQFDPSQQPIYRIKYAINACWSLPDPAFHPNYPVEAYDEMANQQEAYLVKIEEYLDIPYYVDEYVSGGDLEFLITIGDWQATGGNVLDEISHVWLESPTLFGAPVDVRDSMTFVESTTDTRATFNIKLEDMHPSALEDQQILITIESASPDTFEPQIEGDTSGFAYPDAPLAAYKVCDVPVTNLTPQGDYAYVYFIPDWCATMRYQCANDADNQLLMANIISQNVDGYYNDYTHVQSWEGKTNTKYQQNADALEDTVLSLGYTWERTDNDYFDASGSRVVIVVLLNTQLQPPNPPFIEEEADDMKEFIENGGILFFMCEASGYFQAQWVEDLMGWLGMLMEYGGGATPEYSDGWTSNITWHWLTDGVETYHYYSCGTWLTEDPHVLTLVQTEYDENLVLIYPIPLE